MTSSVSFSLTSQQQTPTGSIINMLEAVNPHETFDTTDVPL